MVLASVVLPHPDSPTSATISPASISRFTPSTAVAAARRLPRPANCTRTSTADSTGAVAWPAAVRALFPTVVVLASPLMAAGFFFNGTHGRVVLAGRQYPDPGRPHAAA